MLRIISIPVLCTKSHINKVTQQFRKFLVLEASASNFSHSGLFSDDESEYNPHGSPPSYQSQRSRFGENSRSRYSEKNSSFRERRPFQNRSSFENRDAFYQSHGPRSYENFGQTLSKKDFNLDDLPPVQKEFYVEHMNVEQRSEKEVTDYRKQHSITIRGSGTFKPIMHFDELCLPDALKQIFSQEEFNAPTPIQAQGWPIALSGKDMVGISQTGSGKTLVFILPAIVHALNQANIDARSHNCKPQVLVLAPTRELVQQISEVSQKFGASSGLISACAYGGASKNVQLRNLRGAHICIATPGRLIDFVSEGTVSLENCTYLVMDEADRMLDMGFEPQIRKIVDQIRPDRQTLMWSATWPMEIQRLAEDFLSNYVHVTIGTGELMANPKIEQNIHIVGEYEKNHSLLSLIRSLSEKQEKKILVFAQTKRTVDYLGHNLHDAGLSVLCIHGDISQTRRDHVLNTFRRKKSCILIATDVAARGLDITDIDSVVNYDFPPTIEDYIHRIGRTARGAASGEAHSFFTVENASLAKDLISVLQQANQNVSPELHAMMSSYRKKPKRNASFSRSDFRRRQFSY